MSYENDLIQLKNNPFKIFYPNSLSSKMFRRLFSGEYTWINKLREREDIFINGNRGCGKTTLLYYFKLDILKDKYRNIEDFLNPKVNNEEKVIGVYLDGKSDFEQGNSNFGCSIEDDNLIERFKVNLCLQDVFFTLITRIFTELKVCLIDTLFNIDFNGDKKKEIDFFFRTHLKIELDIENRDDLDLSSSINLINQVLIREQQNNLENFEEILYEDKILEKPKSARSIDIQKFRDFVKLIKRIFPQLEEFSFYILLDDGDRLNKNYQYIFNLLIKPRFHDDFCLKIVLEKGWERWNFAQTQKDHIQFPHDYDMIDLNELYSNNLKIYSHQIRKICERRFSLLEKELNFKEFFPYSRDQLDIYNRFRQAYFEELLAERHEITFEEFKKMSLEKQKIVKKDTNNLINKYLAVKIFRYYKSRGQIPYSGYKNVIYVSSGIIRDFLEIASNMYESVKQKEEKKEVKKIPPKIQTKAIYSNSENFIRRLDKFIEDKKNNELRMKFIKLHNLIHNIGNIFKNRFYNEKLKDVRLFSFVIKDDYDINENLNGVLKIGLRENYIHEYYSTTKDGSRRVKGYTLHRLLLPFFQLDPTSLRGRLEFTTSDLKLFSREKGLIEKGKYKDGYKDLLKFMKDENL